MRRGLYGAGLSGANFYLDTSLLCHSISDHPRLSLLSLLSILNLITPLCPKLLKTWENSPRHNVRAEKSAYRNEKRAMPSLWSCRKPHKELPQILALHAASPRTLSERVFIEDSLTHASPLPQIVFCFRSFPPHVHFHNSSLNKWRCKPILDSVVK